MLLSVVEHQCLVQYVKERISRACICACRLPLETRMGDKQSDIRDLTRESVQDLSENKRPGHLRLLTQGMQHSLLLTSLRIVLLFTVSP